MINKDSISKIDVVLVAVVVITVILGILMIYSAGFDPVDKINSGFYKKQVLWFIFGFLIMIGMTFINYQSLGDYSLQIYAFLIFILLLTTIFGPKIKGARAWINLKYFSIQPSEFMKLALVIILGKYLELRERDIKNFRELFIPALLTMIPVGIILLQPDTGTAAIYLPVLLTMLYVGGADVSHIASIVLISMIGIVIPMMLTFYEISLYQFALKARIIEDLKLEQWMAMCKTGKLPPEIIDKLSTFYKFFRDSGKFSIFALSMFLVSSVAFITHFFSIKKILRRIYIPGYIISIGLFLSVVIQQLLDKNFYQKLRIVTFLNPELIDPQGVGFQIIQSKIAVGSGGFFGKGFLKGTQTQLGFLPEKSSDFLFAVLAEEWGFIGALVLISLLAFIVFRGIQISFEAKDKFGALLASGITAIFFFHIVINIGMVIGIMPVTGLPLCFFSYGGSHMLMAMLGLGILINIRSRKFMY